MNLTKGTKVEYRERVYKGKWPCATFSHNRMIRAVIINDEYVSPNNKHIFSLKILACSDSKYEKGDIIHRRGRNLYRNCLSYDYPNNHDKLVKEKNNRKKKILNYE